MAAPVNPYAGKTVWDSWGRRARNDFTYDPTEGQWEISGSNGPNNYQLFDSPELALAWAQSNPAAAGLGPGPSMSEKAYSASLAQQGIPESELPYGSGQMRTFLAQAGRGLPVAPYLQQWAQQTPGAWGQLGSRMMGERPAALSKILGGKEEWSEDQRKAALIDFLMRTYGGGSSGGSRVAE